MPYRLLPTIILSAFFLTSSAVLGQSTLFSVNAVGFVNKTFKPGVTAVINPLLPNDNGASSLFQSAPIGTTVITVGSGGNFITAFKTFLGWNNGDLELLPGRGFYVYDPTSSPFTITVVGTVQQGDLNLTLRPGTSLLGSLIPQSGLLTSDLQFQPHFGDTAHVFDSAAATANQ